LKIARIITPFAVAALLFVLAYLSSKDVNSGYFPVLLLGVGILLALVGIAAVFSDDK
jgi:hypothetical protein